MGFFTKEVSSTVDAAGNLIEKTGGALDKLFTSDDERLTHAEIMERIKQQPSAWAHELNLINAQSHSWFNSGWRPGLGWVCVLSAGAYFIPQYLTGSVVWVWACVEVISAGGVETLAENLPVYPASDNGLWQLVTLLLGSATVRQIDKANGTAKH